MIGSIELCATKNLGLGAFEPAPGAGVLPSEEAASLASPDGDGAAAGALELNRLLAGGYPLAAGDTNDKDQNIDPLLAKVYKQENVSEWWVHYL